MTSTINASTTAGIVTTADTSGVLALQTAGTTAVSISASQVATFTNPIAGALNGTVGATTANTGAFTTVSATGQISSTAPAGFLVNSSSTNAQIRLTHSGGTAGDFLMQTDSNLSGGIGIYSIGASAYVFSTLGNGALALKGATLSSSGTGITFPATQSASSNANTLDDYEEGTWTPTLTGTSVSGSQTYGTRYGGYTKIGRQVSLNYYCVLTAKGTISGNIYLSGYPFTSSSDNDSVRYGRNIVGFENLATNWVFLSSINDVSVTYSYLAGLKTAASTSAVTNLTDADLTNTTGLSGSVVYNAA